MNDQIPIQTEEDYTQKDTSFNFVFTFYFAELTN